MAKQELFSIGEICKLTKVPRSTLRYYDEVGVIKPASIDKDSGYRYYDTDALQLVCVLRYYQLLGFKLKEIPQLLVRNDLLDLKRHFKDKVKEKDSVIAQLHLEKKSLLSWIDMIDENQTILAQGESSVTLGRFPTTKMFVVTTKPESQPKFRNLLVNNEICTNLPSISTLGPFFIHYPSEDVRFGRKNSEIRVFIKNHDVDDDSPLVQEIQGFQALICYHKGSYENISETYNKMQAWARKHNFPLKGDSIERYIIDYWSITNENMLLTEIYLPLAESE